MEADKKLVRRMSALASLCISEEEEAGFAEDLDVIIGYMKQLEGIDTHGIEPMEHVLSLNNVLRPDIPENRGDTNELMKCAAKTKNGCYIVPNVVDSL